MAKSYRPKPQTREGFKANIWAFCDMSINESARAFVASLPRKVAKQPSGKCGPSFAERSPAALAQRPDNIPQHRAELRSGLSALPFLLVPTQQAPLLPRHRHAPGLQEASIDSNRRLIQWLIPLGNNDPGLQSGSAFP